MLPAFVDRFDSGVDWPHVCHQRDLWPDADTPACLHRADASDL